MIKQSYIDPDLLAGLERLAQASGGFDVATDLERVRRASEARDDALVAQLGVPERIVQETLSITSRNGHIVDLRVQAYLDLIGHRFNMENQTNIMNNDIICPCIECFLV